MIDLIDMIMIGTMWLVIGGVIAFFMMSILFLVISFKRRSIMYALVSLYFTGSIIVISLLFADVLETYILY